MKNKQKNKMLVLLSVVLYRKQRENWSLGPEMHELQHFRRHKNESNVLKKPSRHNMKKYRQY